MGKVSLYLDVFTGANRNIDRHFLSRREKRAVRFDKKVVLNRSLMKQHLLIDWSPTSSA
ncbi:hypothetical protein MHBO_002799 [Bonamia ostreae]|uniref:Uncharacterized protein n=1 Tax=Bonamia ostreae TaxID=126728 RepID=A0ABV2ANK7_9EUKA